MTLKEMKIGERGRVTGIAGADSVRHRLGALGFVPGAVVSVAQIAFGNKILAIHDSRIAVDEELAGRIEIGRIGK